MILQKDLRYINEKYKLSSKLIGLKYDELYSNQTILGRWLRSKSTIIKINDNVFVHGGISKNFIIQNVEFFSILKTYHSICMEECNTYSGCFDNSNYIGNHCDFNNKCGTSHCSFYVYCDLDFVDKVLIILNC